MVFSSASSNAPATFPGLYVAQVEEVTDALELGQIKVSIPSIFGDDNPELFVWARPCFPYGHFFIPEIGDKVWVAFENGDPTAPVWLGIWYPKGAIPSDAMTSPPTKRVIRTASGNVIILNDKQDVTTLEIQDERNTMNVIELANARITIKSKGRIEIDAPILTICGRRVDPTTDRTI